MRPYSSSWVKVKKGILRSLIHVITLYNHNHDNGFNINLFILDFLDARAMWGKDRCEHCSTVDVTTLRTVHMTKCYTWVLNQSATLAQHWPGIESVTLSPAIPVIILLLGRAAEVNTMIVISPCCYREGGLRGPPLAVQRQTAVTPYFNPYSAGIDFRRQKLTPVGVRF